MALSRTIKKIKRRLKASRAFARMGWPQNSSHAPKVSVLVPVYNNERYLGECLDSLKNQTFEDIEFVCVDDGSTDGSLCILNEYAKADSRFKVFSKPNSGYGATMNYALRHARGRYIAILESDDFIEPDAYEYLYKRAAKNRLDLIKSNYFVLKGGENKARRPYSKFEYNKVFNPEKLQDVILTTPAIWAGLYKRQMLAENKIRFNETPGAAYQDTSFVFQVWASAKRVMLVKRCFVHYRLDNGFSSVNSKGKAFAVCDEYAFSCAYLDEFPAKRDAFIKILNRNRWNTYIWNIKRIDDELKPGFAHAIAEEFSDILNAGEMDLEMFSSSQRESVARLLDDPNDFVTGYMEQHKVGEFFDE